MYVRPFLVVGLECVHICTYITYVYICISLSLSLYRSVHIGHLSLMYTRHFPLQLSWGNCLLVCASSRLAPILLQVPDVSPIFLQQVPESGLGSRGLGFRGQDIGLLWDLDFFGRDTST